MQNELEMRAELAQPHLDYPIKCEKNVISMMRCQRPIQTTVHVMP